MCFVLSGRVSRRRRGYPPPTPAYKSAPAPRGVLPAPRAGATLRWRNRRRVRIARRRCCACGRGAAAPRCYPRHGLLVVRAAVLALGLRQDGQQGEEEQQQHYPLPLALPPDESRHQKALRGRLPPVHPPLPLPSAPDGQPAAGRGRRAALAPCCRGSNGEIQKTKALCPLSFPFDDDFCKLQFTVQTSHKSCCGLLDPVLRRFDWMRRVEEMRREAAAQLKRERGLPD